MLQKPARLSDVAKAVGFSVATVSRALQDSPQIAKRTRALIKKAAREMGYEPDPHAVGLASQRNNAQGGARRGTIGLILHDRAQKVRGPFQASLEEQARIHGYGVDVFDLREFLGKERRLLDILLSRGIRGLILDTYPYTAASLAWPWDHFSVVTVFQQQGDQEFHSANVAHLASAQTILAELWSRGYSRPGFIYNPAIFTQSDSYQWKLAFETIRRLLTKGSRPAMDHHLIGPDSPARLLRVKQWLKSVKPDVVIYLGDGWLRRYLERAGYAVPDELGLCALDLIPGQTESGLVQDRAALLERALDLLATLLHRNARGLSREATRIELPARWNAGNTLRPARAFDKDAWRTLLLG